MPRTARIQYPDSRSPAAVPAGTECPDGICTRIEEYHDELFFFGNQLLGQSEHLHYHTNGELSALLSHTLYFCPTCGEVWFRRVFSPHANYNRGPVSWSAFPSLCPKHGGGSIIRFPDDHQSFPLPLLEREVLLLDPRSL